MKFVFKLQYIFLTQTKYLVILVRLITAASKRTVHVQNFKRPRKGKMAVGEGYRFQETVA